MRTQNGNVYTWELELKVFDDTYNENSTNNVPVTLVKDKILGFGVAYNDNDNKMTRESFIGSMDIPGTDKNVAWINASVFDTLKLAESSSTFIKGDVNGDNAVDSIDFAIFKSYLLGIINKFPASNGASSADINDDGLVDSTNYAMLKMYLLGIIKSF